MQDEKSVSDDTVPNPSENIAAAIDSRADPVASFAQLWKDPPHECGDG